MIPKRKKRRKTRMDKELVVERINNALEDLTPYITFYKVGKRSMGEIKEDLEDLCESLVPSETIEEEPDEDIVEPEETDEDVVEPEETE